MKPPVNALNPLRVLIPTLRSPLIPLKGSVSFVGLPNSRGSSLPFPWWLPVSAQVPRSPLPRPS